MLDSDTKRRIDTARDILVGKVPDPKSQVEQITIALIYKFMDDIDSETEEWGGERTFFAGEFAQYGWARLMRSGLGGHEVLGLYAEAIVRMPENPGIPPLFRSIFDNAYLPYRDPETLRAFLKVIDEFAYDHSERLGDAFEYLLSVMDVQGDAGQFRTPRHIIDFIVAIVDPQKHESVLDPACGTAGFLISAYKHILAANSDDGGNTTLTPDDRNRLAANFSGYDISPDMVRLSRVNMYLHDFPDPHIFEYDTLTSEERWNERADVILANPPFMSPKGGIRPHNRFSVKSRRSEVLFVDYMAEHLTPSGRAGIIVPEGIVFQSQNAHKQLRKMLVEDCLVAVISLPAGVFQPYSGVKTSILILDRALARRTDSIAFFKVENDGFDLGAQRRPIDRNDLPQVQAEIVEYLHSLRASEPADAPPPTATSQVAETRAEYTADSPASDSQTKLSLVVEKARIAEDGGYALSGERYRAAHSGNSLFTMVPLIEVAEIIRGITFRKSDQLERATEDSLLVATTKAAQASGIVSEALYHIPRSLLNDYRKLLQPGDILISTANSLHLLGRTTHIQNIDRPISFGAFMSVIRSDRNRILDTYLFRCLRTKFASDFFLKSANTTTNISNLSFSILGEFRLPLPPLDVQREIVAEIEATQKVIAGARAVIDNYRPHIPIDPDWPLVGLDRKDIFTVVSGGTPRSGVKEYWDGSIPWITLVDLPPDDLITEITATKRTITETGLQKSAARMIPANSVVVSSRATIGRIGINRIPLATNQGFKNVVIEDTTQAIPQYVALALTKLVPTMQAQASGATYKEIIKSRFVELQIPLPPLDIQQSIVAEIEAEQALVSANKELVTRMERKIEKTIGRVWGGATTQ